MGIRSILMKVTLKIKHKPTPRRLSFNKDNEGHQSLLGTGDWTRSAGWGWGLAFYGAGKGNFRDARVHLQVSSPAVSVIADLILGFLHPDSPLVLQVNFPAWSFSALLRLLGL